MDQGVIRALKAKYRSVYHLYWSERRSTEDQHFGCGEISRTSMEQGEQWDYPKLLSSCRDFHGRSNKCNWKYWWSIQVNKPLRGCLDWLKLPSPIFCSKGIITCIIHGIFWESKTWNDLKNLFFKSWKLRSNHATHSTFSEILTTKHRSVKRSTVWIAPLLSWVVKIVTKLLAKNTSYMHSNVYNFPSYFHSSNIYKIYTIYTSFHVRLSDMMEVWLSGKGLGLESQGFRFESTIKSIAYMC